MQVNYVLPEWLPYVWELCSREHLRKVECQAFGYSLPSIYKQILAGNLQLWVVTIDGEHVASFTTSIIAHPEAKELVGVHLGGARLRGWAEKAVTILDEFAKENGCSTISIYGRKGTERMYAPFGFTPDVVKLTRKV